MIDKLKQNPLLLVILACFGFLLIGFLISPQPISRPEAETIKIWLGISTIVLVLIWNFLPRNTAISVLILISLFGTANLYYWNKNTLVSHIDSYDVFHYFLGTKYFEEVGYYDLYPVMILADLENGMYDNKLRFYRSQDASGFKTKQDIAKAVQRGRIVRQQRFTQERWKAFEHDFLHLQRKQQLPKGRWRAAVHETGFLATPAWLTVFSPLIKSVPVEWIKGFCRLDILLLGISFGFIYWAYGTIPSLWAYAFFVVTFSLHWLIPGTILLRYPWLCALMVAMALIKKSKPFWGGALTAFSGLMRVFPVVWAFGPGAQWFFGLFNKTISKKRGLTLSFYFLLGFFTLFIGLQAISSFSFGMKTVTQHAQIITAHVKPDRLTSNRAGFTFGTAFNGKTLRYISYKFKKEIDKNKPWLLGISALTLLLLGWGLRKQPLDIAFGFGFIPYFLLTNGSYYYMICRVTLIVLHASDLSRWRNKVGLFILLSLEVFSHWANVAFNNGYRFFLTGYLSWGLTLYTAIMIAFLLYESFDSPNQTSKADDSETRATPLPAN